MAIERFLILDDNATNALFFEMLLRDLGYKHIHVSPTGDHAIEIAEKNHLQFVICVWELKGMPGTLFIQKLRSKKKRKFIPCIIYSKRMSAEDVQLTQELGYKDILAMPFDRSLAKKMIEDIVEHENAISPKENQIRKMEMYLASGQPTEAFKLFTDDLFEPGPFLVQGLIVAAEVLIGLSKDGKAERCIEDALRISPDNTKALQIKARLYSRKGQHDTAISILERLVSRSPKNLTSKIKLGSAYVEAERLEDAKKIFSSVIDIDPDNQECKDQMATVAFHEGDFNLAEQLIAETESGNELARVFNNMAISQVAQGQYDLGIISYRNAMRLLADKARLHLLQYNLGLALRKGGDFQDSLRNLAESYITEPRFEKAYVAVARIVNEMKKKGLKPDRTMIQKVKAARAKIKGKSCKSA
ncbi:MAG: tetratricopeptide repeat protein [Oligoflexus sp.]